MGAIIKVRERFPKLRKIEYIKYQREHEESRMMKEEKTLSRLGDTENKWRSWL